MTTDKKQAQALVDKLRERFTDNEITEAVIELLKKLESERF